jgi:probable rRNA maturation factor
VSHLLVHGVLHLLGFDHEEPDDAQIMRAHEDAVLGSAHHH